MENLMKLSRFVVFLFLILSTCLFAVQNISAQKAITAALALTTPKVEQSAVGNIDRNPLKPADTSSSLDTVRPEAVSCKETPAGFGRHRPTDPIHA
jgi:hypothetical protein